MCFLIKGEKQSNIFSPSEPFWLKCHFARTFLCSCGKGRFLFACFVHWCHQHDVTWAATGSGCCKTTSRRPCGAPFCVAHVPHHTGGLLPRSHSTSQTSRGATSQPPGNVDPRGNSQSSHTVEILPSQHGMPLQCPTYTRGHHRGCSCGSAPFGGSCGSPRRGESSRQAFVDRPQGGKAKLNVPISVQIESTTQYLERARKRLAQAEAEVARVAAQKDQCVADVEAAERRLERLQDSAPPAMQQEPAELVQLQSRIDELIRERDSLRVSANQGPEPRWPDVGRMQTRPR